MQNIRLFIIIGCVCFLLNISIINTFGETEAITDTHDGLRISIETNKKSYYIGDEIKITVTLTNLTNRQLIINSNNTLWWTGPAGSVTWLNPDGTRSIVKDEYPRLAMYYKSHEQDIWWLSKDTIVSSECMKISIMAGKNAEQNCLNMAKEPGNPVLVANFIARRDTLPPDIVNTGNWFGNIGITKTIEVKNEINPNIVKQINRAKAQYSVAKKTVDKEKAIEQLEKIGYPAKDALLELLNHLAVKEEIASQIICILINLSKEAFYEPLYKKLIEEACNQVYDIEYRLLAIEIWRDFRSNMGADDMMGQNNFNAWAIEQLKSLENDPNQKIRERATDLFDSYDYRTSGIDPSIAAREWMWAIYHNRICSNIYTKYSKLRKEFERQNKRPPTLEEEKEIIKKIIPDPKKN